MNIYLKVSKTNTLRERLLGRTYGPIKLDSPNLPIGTSFTRYSDAGVPLQLTINGPPIIAIQGARRDPPTGSSHHTLEDYEDGDTLKIITVTFPVTAETRP